MTMTRNDKTEHTAKMAEGIYAGYTVERFASPRLAYAAIQDRGHSYMTRAEYIEHRMHRSNMHEGRLDLMIELRRNAHRKQRIAIERPIVGRHRVVEARRINGRKPGTKRPSYWSAHEVQRSTRRAA